MAQYKSQRAIAVGKTDAVGIDVSQWLDGETIVSVSVTAQNAFATIGATNINGGVLTVLATGASEGQSDLHFDYQTATRTGCIRLLVDIVDGC